MADKHSVMTDEHKLAAWAYMLSNAKRLMDDRPTDEEFAQELNRETGLSYSTCNARHLRIKSRVRLSTRHQDGTVTQTRVTWRARTNPVLRRTPKGSQLHNDSRARITALQKALADLQDYAVAVESRVEALERVLRDLGAKV